MRIKKDIKLNQRESKSIRIPRACHRLKEIGVVLHVVVTVVIKRSLTENSAFLISYEIFFNSLLKVLDGWGEILCTVMNLAL